MAGLVVADKADRVAAFHHATVESVLDLIGAAGLTSPTQLRRFHLMRRVSLTEVLDLEAIYPPLGKGALLRGDAPERLQSLWDLCVNRFGRTATARIKPIR